MDAAALVLMVAGVGIGYGWQPMPDGSARYEYVVQIDPELVATLGEDASIPIVSDVPEDVHPIGRIRVVVGRGELPRQRLAKSMKPATEGGAIELTQYNEYTYPDPRYGQAQQAAAAAPAGSSWNDGGEQQPAPTGQGATWNDAPVSVAERPADPGPMGRMGDQIDAAAAPLRQGLNRVDEGVRSAVGGLGDRTRNLVDELGRPFQPRAAQPAGSTPQGVDPNAPNAQAWNGGAAAAAAPVTPTPRYSDQGSSWNDNAPAGQPEAPPFLNPNAVGDNSASPAARPANAGGADWNSPNPARPSQRLDQPIDPRDVGRWDNSNPAAPAARPSAADAQGRAAAPADPFDYRNPQNASGRAAASDPLRSPTANPANPSGFPVQDARGSASAQGFDKTLDPTAAPFGANPIRTANAADAAPNIDSRMLQEPAGRPLEGAASPQARTENVVGPAFPNVDPFRSPNNAAQAPAARQQGANGQSWDLGSRAAGNQSPNQSTMNQAALGAAGAATNGRQAAAVLLAWVLLTGSAAGNLYLFWSYQDVRHKYRMLVRKTARAVGSRLSAA